LTEALSYSEAVERVTAPGERYETATIAVDGQPQTVFVNAPEHLRDLFARSRPHGDTDFLVYEDERWSFDRVLDEAAALGRALAGDYGVAKGDRVAIAMRNYPEWVVAFTAITSLGAVSVSMNAWWTEDEMAFAIEDSGAKVVVADRERAERALPSAPRLGHRILATRLGSPLDGVEEWDSILSPHRASTDDPFSLPLGPDDDATILYTSGTTGRPKGAVSTHRAVVQALLGFGCRTAVERLRRPDAPAPRGAPVFILIVPLFHVTGCVPVMLSCFAAGLKLVMMYRWDPERALELIEREQVTNFVGVPTQSWDLLECPRFSEFDTSSLLSVGGGGAPAPPELVRRVAGSFKRASPGIGYGMTETNAYGPQNSGPDYETHPTSTGRATPILQIEVRDPDGRRLPTGERGEIWFRGPNLIRGYWNRPEATAETIVDGWLRSGDIGRVDDEGFVYVEDRAKDMVLRAGENVYCAEVEAALYEHPAVYEAAVFGVEHPRLGEEVAAAIHLRPGMVAGEHDLSEHVAGRLAAFKVPSRYLFTDGPLPRNASGKILKRELRDRLEG
jgi:long-chain acyl-CoA synthetase